MAAFKDVNGRDWLLELDAPTIRTVRQECEGIDLADTEGKSYQRLADNVVLLVDVLWVLCREQAAAKQTTQQMFAKAIVGQAIESATAAMLAAITDFFPPRHRQLLTTVANKNEAMRNLGIARALEKIGDPALEQRIMAGLEAKMDAEIQRVLMQLESATVSPASSESVPAD